MIDFYSETDFVLKKKSTIKKWITHTIQQEEYKLGELCFVFCDDLFLHKLNIEFLNHDTLTDIITFDYTIGKEIHGEIYISVERIKENALEFNVLFEEELHRVMIHGVLHLCGFKDKTRADKILMRQKEDQYLAVFNLPC
ncbi:MAG: rRNA maturation RNase YbeY [Flavobacteriaceae bacterium]